MVMLLVCFASDQVAGLFLGRWVMLVTAFPVNGKSKVKYTTERGELCHFYFHITTLRWFLCHQHHSDIHLYSFLNIWLRQKEALCQKTKQKRGHALAWCLTVSTTQQLEQNSAMPQCCVSLKTTAAIKMSWTYHPDISKWRTTVRMLLHSSLLQWGLAKKIISSFPGFGKSKKKKRNDHKSVITKEVKCYSQKK